MIRIIGDVHGKIERYKILLRECERSIQLGDVGFTTEWNRIDNEFPRLKILAENHKIIPGNHDDYDTLATSEYSLGDFGLSPWEDFPFFFVRGADSIDKHYRIPKITWWKEEQLSYSIFTEKVIPLYEEIKPDLVLTHTAPIDIAHSMFNPYKKYPSVTGSALQEMFDRHQPKLWVFAHWHITSKMKFQNTLFVGLRELDHIDIDETRSLDEEIEKLLTELWGRIIQ